MDYPPNSDASKREQPDVKKVERVISGDVLRKKKPMRRKFSENIVAGDAKSALNYVLFDVLIPAAKDMIAEAGSAGIEKLIFGDSRRRRGATPPQAGPTGYVTYNKPPHLTTAPQRAISRRARSAHDFDEIVLSTREEGNDVIDSMFEVLKRYDVVTVADLYDLVGLQAAHTDHKWGWNDLHGAGVTRIREGYLLDLPEPEPLDR